MTRRALLRVLMLGGIAVAAAACGVKGPVEAPPDKPGTPFPRRYPQEERPL
ncbi:MAG: hypothetical protein GY791_09795 [Alphaproteobacteria bacterium]|nr:hypothetical protein [Alphaproteobacteria bacterium]